jgi:excinuclease ABC subunit C
MSKQILTIENTRKAINTLPTTNGIYQFIAKNNEILYIGKSVNLKARLLSHLESAKTDTKEASFVNYSERINCIITDSEFKALLLESQLISQHKPKYNVRWRDDKSYLYIKITAKETYPKIYLIRRENDNQSLYFGPFSTVKSAEKILREIRKIIPFCTQKKINKKKCFYSKIGLCNPCPNYIEHLTDEELKSSLQKKYKNNIKQITEILNGKTETILKKLYKKLKRLAEEQKYEAAIHYREKILHLESLITRKRLEPDTLSEYNMSEKSITNLKKLLNHYISIEKLDRIECYDVSHLANQNITASMVVFTNGLADKKEYRKFKIKNTEVGSDFERMQEVIERRFKNKWKKPNLIVIDGGKPQLRFIQQILEKMQINIPLIGIAKRPDRIIISSLDMPMIKPPNDNLGFNLVKSIRDESHRFAKKYHTYLRNKNTLQKN